MNTLGRFITVYILFSLAALYLYLHADISVPVNRPLEEFPRSTAGWEMTSQFEFSAGVLDVLKAADYLSRQYTNVAGTKVSLYLGYHSGGKNSGGIHSPKHCLPGSGWFEVSTKQGILTINDQQLKVVRAVYQKGEQKELYLYWFQMMGKSISDEYSLKLAEIVNSMLYRRRDSAFIRISVPFDQDEAGAVRASEQFARDFYPALNSFLPN